MQTPEVTPLTKEEFNHMKVMDDRHYSYPSVEEINLNRKADPSIEEILGAVARKRAREILAKEVLGRNQDQDAA
jgi:hypothetical protein